MKRDDGDAKEREMKIEFQPRSGEPQRVLLRVDLAGKVHFGEPLGDVDLLTLSRDPSGKEALHRAFMVLINEVSILRDRVARLEAGRG